jgi:hypothetical protein
MTPREQIIEVMARAMTPDPDSVVFAVGGTGGTMLHDILYAWEANKQKAESALTALESSGYQVRPREATRGMVFAIDNAGIGVLLKDVRLIDTAMTEAWDKEQNND